MKQIVIVLAVCIMASNLSFGQKSGKEETTPACPYPSWPIFETQPDRFPVERINELQKINPHYYKNDTCVYIYNSIDIGSARSVMVKSLNLVEGADPATFVGADTNEYSTYAKDKNRVYINGFVIPEANPQDFTVMKSSYYSKDNESVFFLNCKIEGADLPTFKEVMVTDYPYVFAYDKNYVYYSYKKEKIDYRTFELKINEYGHTSNVCSDKNFIYTFDGDIINGNIKKEKR